MNTSIFYCLVLAFLIGSTATSTGQTNGYADPISGFEVGVYIANTPQPANAFAASIDSTTKIAGARSIKFDCPDASVSTGGNATAIIGGTNASFSSGNIAVTAGTYVFTAKIFVKGKAPANMLVYLAEKIVTITAGITLTIPLSGIKSDSWQTISQQVTFPADIPEMKTGLRIRGTDYAGMTGLSTIYVDQIGLFDADQYTDTTPVRYSPILNPNNNWNINKSFSDEFNAPGLDLDKWNTDVDDWGTWSWSPENVYQKDTVLAIRMQQHQHTRGGQEYYFTSGIAQLKQVFTYGYFEASIRASSKGQGTCPAFWVYSVNQPVPTEEQGVQYSEIDAVEIFQVPNQYKHLEMNLHTRVLENGALVWKRPGTKYTELCHNEWNAPWDPRDEYHTYGVWNRLDSIFWYVDGLQRGAKKNEYWHLPMYLTVSMGLRTPYEKYVDGVRTIVPYPDTIAEPGFPTEMYCDYVRVWDTPPQLYANKAAYQNAEFYSDSTLTFVCRYFAGSGKKVLANQWNGVACKLQQIAADGSVVTEQIVTDNSAIGKESGVATFTFSLAGFKPSSELPAGNQYLLKPVFRSSLEPDADIFMDGEMDTIQIVKNLSTSTSVISNDKKQLSPKLFPNPASTILNISVPSSTTVATTFDLINSVGQIVFSGLLSGGMNQIDVSKFTKGIYLLRTKDFGSEKLILK